MTGAEQSFFNVFARISKSLESISKSLEILAKSRTESEKILKDALIQKEMRKRRGVIVEGNGQQSSRPPLRGHPPFRGFRGPLTDSPPA